MWVLGWCGFTSKWAGWWVIREERRSSERASATNVRVPGSGCLAVKILMCSVMCG